MTDIRRFKSVLYISPHLDDAVLSAGGLIGLQVASGSRVVVATMVTADPVGIPLSPLATRYFEAWGSPDSPFGDRCVEDELAVAALGAAWRHAGLLDCTYRRSTNGRFFYDSMESLFSAVPDPEDAEFQQAVASNVERLLDMETIDCIVTAATVGRHVDHVCVLSAVIEVARRRRLPLYVWEDQPYSTGVYPPDNPDTIGSALNRLGQPGAEPTTVAIDLPAKLRACRHYASQLDDLFGSPTRMEEVMTRYSAGLGSPLPSERFWRLQP